jgi:DNA topoisomerase/Nucleotidyl transferase AbiEii toxin, Type IV TA system
MERAWIDDDVVFDVMGLQIDLIRENLEYGSLRIKTNATIGRARVRVVIDIGFGYAVEPGIAELEARLFGAYPRETVIAEKFQAMVVLGRANSRMNDFHDSWLLSRRVQLNSTTTDWPVRSQRHLPDADRAGDLDRRALLDAISFAICSHLSFFETSQYGQSDRHHGEIQPGERRPRRRWFLLRRNPSGRGSFARPARTGRCHAGVEALVADPAAARRSLRHSTGGRRQQSRQAQSHSRGIAYRQAGLDRDREGQLIGQEILEHYEYRGQVMRVLFTAQDAQTIRDAFGRAKPNSEYARLYAAAVARRQADQIYNLSLTRTATVILGRGARRVIGVGRVKTPTLPIVCKRELEIRNFVPLAYFEVVATAKVAGGQFQMRHAPQDRIVRREIAQDVVNAARGFEGALAVRVEDKRQGPPKLHDLPSLQKLCGSPLELIFLHSESADGCNARRAPALR